MSIKKKLGLGIASAALGMSLVGGGTFAYFNDTETVNNNFVAGKLDLSVNPDVAFDIKNLKPGDYMTRSFTMSNGGTLPIAKVLMNVESTGTADFDNFLRVDFLDSDGKEITALSGKTIAQLKNIKNTDITPGFWKFFLNWENEGLPKGDTDKIEVKITFVDNGQNQNHLQEGSLNVKFNLEAKQTAGERK